MNKPATDYSAVYAGMGSCPCQQPMPAAAANPMSMPMPAAAMPMPMPAAGQQTMPMPFGIGFMPQSASQQGAGTAASAAMGVQPSTPATTGQLMPITDMTQPAPLTAESIEFLNGFMRTQIGRRVRVEFLIGTNTFTDKAGTLLSVGANYILLREANSDDLLACDFFNIKFITFFY